MRVQAAGDDTVSTDGHSRIGAPPLPEKLPGDFFVLEFDRDRERFTLIVDDADETSYNLGNDIQKVMMRFRVWGLVLLGDRVIDIAKEFGACQGIPSQDRAIPLYERPAAKALRTQRVDFSKEDSKYAGHLPGF